MHWMNLQCGSHAGPRTPDRGRLLVGARALDEVRVQDTAAIRDLLDAAAELHLVVTERCGEIAEVKRGGRLMYPLAINPALPS
jgi:hypothetical protein